MAGYGWPRSMGVCLSGHASCALLNVAPTSASAAELRTFAHDFGGDMDGSVYGCIIGVVVVA